MGAMPIVTRQARCQAVGREGNQKNCCIVGGGYHRDLGDISNMIHARGNNCKTHPWISRPFSRSFCAQLLANAVKGNEITVYLEVDGGTVVDIVAGTAEGNVSKGAAAGKIFMVKPEDEEKPASMKELGEGLSRQKCRTLTFILAGRRKEVCGPIEKPKIQIDDIDAGDVGNELAVVEYVEDMYKFYKIAENESRLHDYMGSQPEINEGMRAMLVTWLIQVHKRSKLTVETLYLTVHIVDRFLSMKAVCRRELLLVGISAMFLASKYEEEERVPEVLSLICISEAAYTRKQILKMEKTILATLEWTLTVPTAYVFLVRYIKASIPDPEMENMVYVFANLALIDYATIKYRPSVVAASAVYAARYMLKKCPVWTDTLIHYTGFSEPQLMDCSGLLVERLHRASCLIGEV